MPLGSIAHAQGRVAGENAIGGSAEFVRSLGTQVVKVCDLAIAATRLRENAARDEGFDPLTVETTTDDHKAYYPGRASAAPADVVARERGLLGAQILGHLSAQVAKRIDTPARPAHLWRTHIRWVSQASPNAFALSGQWRITGESATTLSSATITANVHARHVYLVLSSADGRPCRVRLVLNGHPIAPNQSGSDVHGSALTVRTQRLYSLVSLPSTQTVLLTLELDPGLSGYAFTFG